MKVLVKYEELKMPEINVPKNASELPEKRKDFFEPPMKVEQQTFMDKVKSTLSFLIKWKTLLNYIWIDKLSYHLPQKPSM